MQNAPHIGNKLSKCRQSFSLPYVDGARDCIHMLHLPVCNGNVAVRRTNLIELSES